MSLIRAIRLGNSLEAGTTDATALEALLADSTRKGEFAGLCSIRGQARRLADNATPLAAINGSPAALAVLMDSRSGCDEFAASPVASAALAGNRVAMRAATVSINGYRRWLAQFPYVIRDLGWQVKDVAYGSGVYVAVGDGAGIASSADGVTWTQRASPIATTNIQAVSYAFGLFIAINADGKIFTSSDGATWTQRVNPITYNNSVSASMQLVQGEGKIAFAMSATATAVNLVYSSDGINWSTLTTTLGSSGGGVTAAYTLAYTGLFWTLTTAAQASTTYAGWSTPTGLTAASAWSMNGLICTNAQSCYGQYFLNGFLYTDYDGAKKRLAPNLSLRNSYSTTELQYTYGMAYWNGVLLAMDNNTLKWSLDNGLSWQIAGIARPVAMTTNSRIKVLNNTLFFINATTNSLVANY